MPSERELAQSYGVSRVTVRRALNDLVEAGFLRRGKRRGAVVNDISCAVQADAVHDARGLGAQIASAHAAADQAERGQNARRS